MQYHNQKDKHRKATWIRQIPTKSQVAQLNCDQPYYHIILQDRSVILSCCVTFSQALQYWVIGSKVLHTLHIQWHFVGSQVAYVALWRKQSTASAFLYGPTLTYSAVCGWVCVCVWSTRQNVSPAQPKGELCTQLCKFTQGEKVTEMLLTHLLCSCWE